jgi:hypothetical protein
MGAVPQAPEQRGDLKVVDIVVATLLWLGLSVLSVVAGAMALLLAMAADSCGTNPDEPILCGTGGVLLFLLGIGVLWLVLAVGVIGSAVMIVRGAVRGRRTWHWPLAGLALGVAGCAGMFGWMVLLTHV